MDGLELFGEPSVSVDQALIWIETRDAALVVKASDGCGPDRLTWMDYQIDNIDVAAPDDVPNGTMTQGAMTEESLRRLNKSEFDLLDALWTDRLVAKPGKHCVSVAWFERASFIHRDSGMWFVHLDGGGPDLGPQFARPRFDSRALLAAFPPASDDHPATAIVAQELDPLSQDVAVSARGAPSPSPKGMRLAVCQVMDEEWQGMPPREIRDVYAAGIIAKRLNARGLEAPKDIPRMLRDMRKKATQSE
jgi:hypothetical protein